jgi:PAS domain S-box-containing protein
MGYTPEEWEARGGWTAFIHPDDLPGALERMHTRLLRGEPETSEARFLTRDGEVRWVQYSTRPVWDPGGKRVARFYGAAQDVTERKWAEEALRESDRCVRNVLESMTDAFLATDREWRVAYVNRQAERALRRSREELLGRNLWEAYPDAVGSTFYRKYHEVIASGEPAHFEEYYPPLEGWFEVHAYPSAEGLGVYFRDVTERKRAQERLHEYAQRLRALAHRLLEVQEQERRHLARELHDEVGQLLTGLKLNLEVCGRVPAAALPGRLEAARSLVRDLSAQVRDLSLRLRPTMLDDLGLVPALAWQLERYTAQTGVRVAFEHHGVGGRFPAEVETAAYRIVQEGLTNVARHADIGEAVVRLWADGSVLGVQVEDQGAGFDPDAALADGTSGGLSGMLERATLLGGHFEVTSRPGAGTRLAVELPLAEGDGS